MSEPLIVQGDVGFDSVCLKPNINIQVNDTNGSTNIEEPLALKITNRNDYIIITGVFNFKIIIGSSGITSSDYLNIKIELYRENSRINIAYYTEEQDAGIVVVASGYKTIQIPIQLVERISIPATEEYAKYFISIIATSNKNDYGTVLLKNFCICGSEIALEEAIYCEDV